MTALSPRQRAQDSFERIFQGTADQVLSAPGRVNLMGEHTDYNDGFVLPVALSFETAIAASPRSDRVLDVIACDANEARVRLELDAPLIADPQRPWSNYLRGVVQALFARGFRLGGAQLAMSGNVPQGAGLSSSAALEVVLAATLTQLAGEPLDGLTAAQVGQAAENDFVGCQCGIMDQLASALGRKGHALLIDCRTLGSEPVPLPPDYSLLIVHSNVRRELAVDGAYNERRAQCEAAAAHCGVPALRDLSLAELNAQGQTLDRLAFRRARHVITDSARTHALAAAMAASDGAVIAELMAESHRSMREDFEITVPAIDALVDLINGELAGDGGARMTGGGFGGCVVALIPENARERVVRKLQQDYPKRTGLTPTVFECETRDGAFVTAGLTP